MIRTFKTHKIRKMKELSSCLWDFETLSGVGDCRQQVYVPSCWENYPGTAAYIGKARYCRTFEAEGNVRLEFKGVSHTASVYVDGEKVASHYNAYTIFDAIVPNLRPGIHTLEIIADNSFGPESALHVPNDYQSYGGVSRAVVMEEIGDVYIKWIHFTPLLKRNENAEGKAWFGKAEIDLCNVSDWDFTGNIVVNFAGHRLVSLPVTLRGKETRVITTEELLCREAEEWSPESPRLYSIEAILEDKNNVSVDDLIERVGFRTVEVSGKDILLNGKKLLIKGLCRHEDHPQFGCALPLEAMQYDLMIAKDLGANSIRTTHYPNDELFLDLCDEQGILVWEENHARGLSEELMRNPYFDKQCEDCIYEMITAHYNHPSIYIWGILNECASHTEYGKACYEAQYEWIRKLDASRPRSSASCQFKTDICFGYPEIVSYNIYPKWYHDTPVKEYLKDLYEWVQDNTEGKEKPFLITEIGAGALYGYRHPSHVKWTEEYQAETLKEQITAVFEQDGCSGIYVWQFCDTRVSSSWFGTRPRTMNNKGIVDEYRRAKLSYEIVKGMYKAKGNYKL
ncbi:Beta-glucuronidase [Blautia producta]|uniref:Beta-glucuronidase n=1 Tax=Blautia producta TaxID=33035 RepID=A0A4P6LZV1_9FIRM|nr:glycoside hydrolase family 2 TIM barrel-domain containing protein [Blautia producta]QBE97736.1 Beta-glucuronidase [Blautia producta]